MRIKTFIIFLIVCLSNFVSAEYADQLNSSYPPITLNATADNVTRYLRILNYANVTDTTMFFNANNATGEEIEYIVSDGSYLGDDIVKSGGCDHAETRTHDTANFIDGDINTYASFNIYCGSPGTAEVKGNYSFSYYDLFNHTPHNLTFRFRANTVLFGGQTVYIKMHNFVTGELDTIYSISGTAGGISPDLNITVAYSDVYRNVSGHGIIQLQHYHTGGSLDIQSVAFYGFIFNDTELHRPYDAHLDIGNDNVWEWNVTENFYKSQALNTFGLVNYYSFQTNVSPNYGSDEGTNNGTMLTDGYFGSGRYFDGDDSIIIDDNISGYDSMTLSAWIYSDGTTGAIQNIITRRETVKPSYLFNFDTARKINCLFYNTTGGNDGASTSSAINYNQWYHVACVLNGTHYTQYINGVQDGTIKDFVGEIRAEGDDVCIGCSEGSAEAPQQWFNGTIDEVYIYNRSLSNNELIKLYENNTLLNNFNTSIMSHLPFCDCEGCSVDGDYCNLPFTWYSLTDGLIEITELNVSYDVNFNLTNCSIGEYALNFTIRNETNNALIDADIDGTFYYTYGGINKELDIDLDDVNNFSVCVYPSYVNFTGNYSVRYSNDDYPQRRYIDTNAIYSNNTQDVTLQLLYYSDALYGRFAVFDVYNNPLQDVQITMRDDSGVTIEQEVTDDAGQASFIVSPDEDYTFTFVLIGYRVYSTTLRITESDIRTVFLEAETVSTINESVYSSINEQYTPTLGSILNIQTDVTFAFNLSSDYRDITYCEIYIWNMTDTLLGSASGTYDADNCYATTTAHTGNLSKVEFQIVYELDNNYTINRLLYYTVMNTSISPYSIRYLLDDIKNLTDAGFDDFTKMFIALVVTFVLCGMAAMKLGIRDNQESIILIFLACTLVFSVLGFYTLDYENIPTSHLKQYLLFYLLLLLGSSYIIRRHA